MLLASMVPRYAKSVLYRAMLGLHTAKMVANSCISMLPISGALWEFPPGSLRSN